MKTCIQCKNRFEVSSRDKEFYKKISPVFGGKTFQIPEPTMCPLCRQMRRFAFRNERHLYKRKCDGSGKEIISMYSPESPYKVYAQDVWWQGNWDASQYGRDFDFSRPFFDQYKELMLATPRIALLNVNSVNSDYCNFTGDVKNSYLIFGSVYSEDCYYGSPYYSKNCVDTLVLRDCELCYECIDCRKLYNCLYCQDCNGSNDLLYCFDLQACSDCIGCVGLRNKKYCYFNQQLSKEKYVEIRKGINLCDLACVEFLAEEFEKLRRTVPHLCMLATGSVNVSGSHIFHSKNTSQSFFSDRCEDCSYCAQVVDLKDCFDNNYTEENELCYEYLGMYSTTRTFFSMFCRHTSETFYSDYCVNCQNLFGCTNLRDKKYAILNKIYTKAEYESLVSRIVSHMKETGEWGEFPPMSISPFAYNETVAHEYFPRVREDVLAAGLRWKDDDRKEFQQQTVSVPLDIKEVKDNICYEILACEVTGKNFRIIPQELAFYRRMNIPIPRRHPDQRHAERIAKRNPRMLFDRVCDKCGKKILTSYPKESPYRVYCEKCYLGEVY
jgi:hypothetical protein